MTTALCLNCGDLKWGALWSRCPKCHAGSSGALDTVFSTHFLTTQTLRDLGSVVKKIQPACQDPELAYWAFISYLSEHYPAIMTADIKPDMRSRVTQVMQGLVLPRVKLPDSREAHGDPGSDAETADTAVLREKYPGTQEDPEG